MATAQKTDVTRTPTRRSGTNSATTTPRSARRLNGPQRKLFEDDLPLPPQDLTQLESPNIDAYFMPLPESRAASIYSVNRATLSGQLSHQFALQQITIAIT